MAFLHGVFVDEGVHIGQRTWNVFTAVRKTLRRMLRTYQSLGTGTLISYIAKHDIARCVLEFDVNF